MLFRSRFPTGTGVIYPPQPVPSSDPVALVEGAFANPVDSAPLAGLLRPGMKLTVLVGNVDPVQPCMRFVALAPTAGLGRLLARETGGRAARRLSAAFHGSGWCRDLPVAGPVILTGIYVGPVSPMSPRIMTPWVRRRSSGERGREIGKASCRERV